MNLHETLLNLGQQAKTASYQLALLTSAQKNAGLQSIANAMLQQQPAILAANNEDLTAAKKAGLSAALTDRLTLNSERIASIAYSIEKIGELPDPIGHLLSEQIRPNGLKIRKVRVPSASSPSFMRRARMLPPMLLPCA